MENCREALNKHKFYWHNFYWTDTIFARMLLPSSKASRGSVPLNNASFIFFVCYIAEESGTVVVEKEAEPPENLLFTVSRKII